MHTQPSLDPILQAFIDLNPQPQASLSLACSKFEPVDVQIAEGPEVA